MRELPTRSCHTQRLFSVTEQCAAACLNWVLAAPASFSAPVGCFHARAAAALAPSVGNSSSPGSVQQWLGFFAWKQQQLEAKVCRRLGACPGWQQQMSSSCMWASCRQCCWPACLLRLAAGTLSCGCTAGVSALGAAAGTHSHSCCCSSSLRADGRWCTWTRVCLFDCASSSSSSSTMYACLGLGVTLHGPSRARRFRVSCRVCCVCVCVCREGSSKQLGTMSQHCSSVFHCRRRNRALAANRESDRGIS